MKVVVFQSFGICPRCIVGRAQKIVVVVESDAESAKRRLDELVRERVDWNRGGELPQVHTFPDAKVIACCESDQPGIVFAPISAHGLT
jgi:hypothetical protein